MRRLRRRGWIALTTTAIISLIYLASIAAPYFLLGPVAISGDPLPTPIHLDFIRAPAAKAVLLRQFSWKDYFQRIVTGDLHNPNDVTFFSNGPNEAMITSRHGYVWLALQDNGSWHIAGSDHHPKTIRMKSGKEVPPTSESPPAPAPQAPPPAY